MGHTLDDLALLVDVVRAGGVRAARDLGVPRSTVSRRLQRLEASLGVGLKRKGTGALEFTEAAQSSFERVARLVDEAREVSEELGNQQVEPRGVLRLATTALFAEHVLPELMAKFLAAYPRVRVEVLSSTDRLDLTAERIDVAIRAGPLEDLATWTSKRLRTVTTVGLYASPAYLKSTWVRAEIHLVYPLAAPPRTQLHDQSADLAAGWRGDRIEVVHLGGRTVAVWAVNFSSSAQADRLCGVWSKVTGGKPQADGSVYVVTRIGNTAVLLENVPAAELKNVEAAAAATFN